MRVFVTGTGTDVGKTHVASCLLRLARERGTRARAYKPVASGLADGRCEDAEAHAAALGGPVEAPTYAFRDPISPSVAARREGVTVDIAVITEHVREMEAGADLILVEGAGGLFSPLGDAITNADLAVALAPCAVLLVAPDRLGVLHDLRATLLAARASGVSIDAFVLSAPKEPDASTSTNEAELERIGLGAPAAIFERARFDDQISLRAAAQVWAVLVSRNATTPRRNSREGS